uniref:Uncharacterized protein n=1 Tax=Mycena chlorophos TaxID=658473 RepID=A0ABQ0L748_MYCCL|nr:predicted protein [Mycena chlorophos]
MKKPTSEGSQSVEAASPPTSPPMPTQTPSSLGSEPSNNSSNDSAPATPVPRPASPPETNADSHSPTLPPTAMRMPVAPRRIALPTRKHGVEQAQAAVPAVVEQTVDTAEEIVVVTEEQLKPVLVLEAPHASTALAQPVATTTTQVRDETPTARTRVGTSFQRPSSSFLRLRWCLRRCQSRKRLWWPRAISRRTSVVQAFAEGIEDADAGEVVEQAVQELEKEQLELEAAEDAIVGAPIVVGATEPVVEEALVVEPGLAIKSDSAIIEVVVICQRGTSSRGCRARSPSHARTRCTESTSGVARSTGIEGIQAFTMVREMATTSSSLWCTGSRVRECMALLVLHLNGLLYAPHRRPPALSHPPPHPSSLLFVDLEEDGDQDATVVVSATSTPQLVVGVALEYALRMRYAFANNAEAPPPAPRFRDVGDEQSRCRWRLRRVAREMSLSGNQTTSSTDGWRMVWVVEDFRDGFNVEG